MPHLPTHQNGEHGMSSLLIPLYASIRSLLLLRPVPAKPASDPFLQAVFLLRVLPRSLSLLQLFLAGSTSSATTAIILTPMTLIAASEIAAYAVCGVSSSHVRRPDHADHCDSQLSVARRDSSVPSEEPFCCRSCKCDWPRCRSVEFRYVVRVRGQQYCRGGIAT